MREVLIAVLIGFVDSAVRSVEAHFPRSTPGSKRLHAFKIVRDRLHSLQSAIGMLPTVDDSTVYGVIDSTVESFHRMGEFEHATENRQYRGQAPLSAFQYTAPDGGKKWGRINPDTGELEAVRLVPDPLNPSQRIPARSVEDIENESGGPIPEGELVPVGEETPRPAKRKK
jgi:hypothetical protein